MEMGERIKELRIAKGLTQEQLAEKLGLQKSAIAKYENGRVENIKRSNIQALSEILDTSPAYLMGWSDYVTCPTCGFCYDCGNVKQAADHDEYHTLANAAIKKYGKLYIGNNEDVKAKSRQLASASSLSLEERYQAQLEVIRCLFSRSLMANHFNFEHPVFEDYVAMLINTSYSDNIKSDVYTRLKKNFGLQSGIDNGSSIYYLERKNIESTFELLNLYSKLNTGNKIKTLKYIHDQLQEQNNVARNKKQYREIKVTEKLAAGRGYSYSENNDFTYVKTDRDDLANYNLASFVTGDSMYPAYEEGDVVLIQQGYDNCQGAVYAIDYDGKSFLKKVYFEGNRFRLVSINENYSDIYISLPIEDDTYLNIVGRVVDKFKPVEG